MKICVMLSIFISDVGLGSNNVCSEPRATLKGKPLIKNQNKTQFILYYHWVWDHGRSVLVAISARLEDNIK